MTSRERVHRAINFLRPDRVPIDLGAMRAGSINAVLYDRLKRRYGLNTPTKTNGTLDVLAQLEPEIIDRFHLDVLPRKRSMRRGTNCPPRPARRIAFTAT